MAVKSSSASGKLPLTGVADFDRLVVGTKFFSSWQDKLGVRGFQVIAQSLPLGTAALIEGWIITHDPQQFRFVDLLHEARHVMQIEKALAAGLEPFAAGGLAKLLRAWFELGAYEYEQRLSACFGFSAEYNDFLERQIQAYWKRAYRQKVRFSPATRKYLERIGR